MTRIEKSIEINAPVEKVFEFVADWENVSKYFMGISDFKPTTEKTRGDGARFSFKAKILGVEQEMEEEVSNFVENEGWTMTSVTDFESKDHWAFEPLDDQTKVTYTLEYELLGTLQKVLDALLVKRQWETNIEKSLQNLKRLLEA